MRRLFLLSLVLLLAFAAPVAADDDKPEADKGFPIAIGNEDVPMEQFLRAVSKACGVPLVWNPSDRNIVGKKIIGNVDMDLPRDQLFDYARALLTFYELVMIPVGPEGYQVQLVMDARQTSSILKLKPEHVQLTDDNLEEFAGDDGRFLTTTIRVEHMDDLRAARNALTRIVTGQNIGNVTEVPAARAFVVTDFAPNVVAIYRLLREMDQPQAKPSTTLGRTIAVTLEHANATELAHVLSRHFAPEAAAPRPARAPQASPTHPPSAPRITADARTNRILVTGDEAEIKAVQGAIALLDTRVPTPQVSAALIRLKHVNAMQAMGSLSALIRGSPALWSAGGARPTIVAHEAAGLLVAASDADMAKIRDLIAEMDKAP